MTASHADEIRAGRRFEFGANWARFLEELDDDRIAAAEASLQRMLDRPSLSGLRFLDAGSGSGLFSLAARRLGATVSSFDFDPASVACTQTLRERYFSGDAGWTVAVGSVLDREFLRRLGAFDVVYSWGVLHHTGAMWDALDGVLGTVAPGGRAFIALYNDQGWRSRYWHAVKRLYVRRRWLRGPLLAAHLPYPFLPALIAQRLRSGVPVRGMSFWRDVIDWVGGYPFEVASPEIVRAFLEQRGFVEERSTLTRRWGCNEFVFRRSGPCAG